jgi:hypothetical protein
MRVSNRLLLPALALLAALAAGAAEPTTFEVEVVKDIAYREGKDADPVRHKLDLYLPEVQRYPPSSARRGVLPAEGVQLAGRPAQ